MTPELWQRVNEILLHTWELDAGDRAGFLDQACRDEPEVRSMVESLLATDERIGEFLAAPAIEVARAQAAAAQPYAAAMAAAEAFNLRPPNAMSEPTLILKERYEVVRELGRGGMSVVYLARDHRLLAKLVVIKVLLEETQQDPWVRQKFQQEMEALARIDHPGVVGVLDTGLTAEGHQFLVMQYVEGSTLRSVIEPGGMNFVRAASLIRQVGQALAAAHEKGVWHRDLKPENIMLQRQGGEDHIRLIDFGIAGIQNSQFRGEKTKVAGSLTYMAPEQFAGKPGAASDTFALGVVAYEILTGRVPFSADSMTRLIAEDQSRPVPPRQLRPDLPEAAERSILKALSFRPELRHAEVREFSEGLWRALTSGEPARPQATAAPGTVEIAHVLFTDLVGYSLLSMDQQKEHLGQLQEIVQSSPQFRASEAHGDIISLPTGDGVALAFFRDPTAPAQCALEVAAGLKGKPHLKLRMGIHSGPVYRMADVNANANLAGGGINIAQRVMDCGDAGHILVSKSTADVLLQLNQWSPYLADLGECTVKHGVKVHLCNLSTAELGNRERPRKLGSAVPKARVKIPLVAVLTLLAVAAAAGTFWLERGRENLQPAPDQGSIAVLPFADMSPGKDQEYFSEGLAEELINALATVPRLRVVARRSSFQFKGKAEDVSAIGKKLGVAAILEGSVRQQGGRARISVQLIKASDGFHLWSETYDRDMNDIFAVEEDIARAVTGSLEVTLLKRKSPLPARKTNPEAYNDYLKGRHEYLSGYTLESIEKAIAYFHRALDLDPGYAQAFEGMAECYWGLSSVYYPPTEVMPKAKWAAQKAIELDDTQGEAHGMLGMVSSQFEFNREEAAREFQRALDLKPSDAQVHLWYSMHLAELGRFDAALSESEQAQKLDPVSPFVNAYLGVTLFFARRYDQLIQRMRPLIDMDPNQQQAHAFLALAYEQKGQYAEAIKEMEKAYELDKDQDGLAQLGHMYAVSGRTADARRVLRQLSDPARWRYVSAYNMGVLHAGLGERDEAFRWFQKVEQDRSEWFAAINVDPRLDELHADTRFAGILRKVGLAR